MEQEQLGAIIVCRRIIEIQCLYDTIGEIPGVRIYSAISDGNTVQYRLASADLELLELAIDTFRRKCDAIR